MIAPHRHRLHAGREETPPGPRVAEVAELLARVRDEIHAAHTDLAGPAVEVRAERIVSVVSQFVLDWVEG